MHQSFNELHERRLALANAVDAMMRARIDARRPGPRDQHADDELFSPLNTAIARAVDQKDHRLAMWIFQTCYEHALEYERLNNCQMHKGAPTFNIGIAHLQVFDFPAAMHFFELAQKETRLTTRESSWDIYADILFDRNFWGAVEASQADYPLKVYRELWGVDLDKDKSQANWRQISKGSKLLYIVSVARRIAYRQLEAQSRWDGSNSLALAYWNLAGDLSRLLETEVKRLASRRAPSQSLHDLVIQGFANTKRLGNLSALVKALHKKHRVKDTKKFNRAFTSLRKSILNPKLSKAERVANAVYLLYATRNQVQHHVDMTMVIYRRPEAARFLVDVLLSLCSLDSWTI